MTHHDERREPTPADEAALQALFDSTAAPLSDDAARRLEAVARGIVADRSRQRSPLLWWLAAATGLAAAAVLALLLGPGGPSVPAEPGAPTLAMTQDVLGDLGTDAAPSVATLAEEQFEGWEQGYGPFDEDEAPSLVGSVSLAGGPDNPDEVELWVQAADEILAEVDEI